jgi:GNAT superfamily N-acetyltransferase
MITSPEHIQIEYGVYVPSEAEAMTKLLAEAFSRHDPLAVAAGVTTAEFESFVRILAPSVAGEGLTIVARFAGTRELAGALLTEDAASAAPEGLEQMGEKFAPIADILGQLVTEYRAGQAPRHGEMLHLYLLGVSDRAARRGVGQQLIASCIENGARRGYRVAVAEATNKVSQHIFQKQGFTARAQRSYRDYLFQGRPVFQTIAEHDGPILMEKSLVPPAE